MLSMAVSLQFAHFFWSWRGGLNATCACGHRGAVTIRNNDGLVVAGPKPPRLFCSLTVVWLLVTLMKSLNLFPSVWCVCTVEMPLGSKM